MIMTNFIYTVTQKYYAFLECFRHKQKIHAVQLQIKSSECKTRSDETMQCNYKLNQVNAKKIRLSNELNAWLKAV